MDFMKMALQALPEQQPLVKEVAKRRIRAGSPEYFEWVGVKAPMRVEHLEPEAGQCEACNGTGIYVGPKWSRPCFRCRGLGVIDTVQANRNAYYDGLGDAHKVTTAVYEKEHGTNTFH